MQIGVDSSQAVENRRVFIIDEDEITRAALRFMLHDEYEAHELPDLESASAKARHWKPDLLLVGGRSQDAPDRVEAIRAQFPGVGLILVTEARVSHPADADAVLEKPLRIEQVRTTVAQTLQQRTRAPV